jgi:hypothetical protein
MLCFNEKRRKPARGLDKILSQTRVAPGRGERREPVTKPVYIRGSQALAPPENLARQKTAANVSTLIYSFNVRQAASGLLSCS